MKPETLELITVTAELCGHVMSDAAARILVADLETYPESQVVGALAKCRRELRGRLTLPEILSRLDDGRPGPEEAWATMPKSEQDSAVLTQEQLTAWGIVHELHAEDPIAARMAFKESYTRLVSESRAARAPVEWHVSLGIEKTGRASALQAAALAGKVPFQYALNHCPVDHLPQLQMAFGTVPERQVEGLKRDVKGALKGALAGKVVSEQ